MRTRGVVVAIAAVVVVLVAAVIGIVVLGSDDPIATGRGTDACPAEGPVGLVGLDAGTGHVEWTNVVGSSVADLWRPRGAVGGPAHLSRFLVMDDAGAVRTIDARTGGVRSCPKAADLTEADQRAPVLVDPVGAKARDRAAGAVDVVERDGTVRWTARDRHLVGASVGGVVVRSDIGQDDQGDCCDGTTPDISVEVLAPDTADVRWSKEVRGLDGIVTEDHLIVFDQFAGEVEAPDPLEDTIDVGPSVVTAYDLIDGTESWHVRLPAAVTHVFAADGVVLIPNGSGHGTTLVAVEEGTGEKRWNTALPDPGHGGPYTVPGAVPAVAVSGDVVAVAVVAGEPYRD